MEYKEEVNREEEFLSTEEKQSGVSSRSPTPLSSVEGRLLQRTRSLSHSSFTESLDSKASESDGERRQSVEEELDSTIRSPSPLTSYHEQTLTEDVLEKSAEIAGGKVEGHEGMETLDPGSHNVDYSTSFEQASLTATRSDGEVSSSSIKYLKEGLESERSDSTQFSSASMGGDLADQEDKFHVGQRVLIGNKMQGVVQFVGTTHFSPGLWVGVEIGVPKGRNDGSINGERYFTCKPNHGLFAPPRKLTIIDEASHPISEHITQDAISEASDSEGVEMTSQPSYRSDFDVDEGLKASESSEEDSRETSPVSVADDKKEEVKSETDKSVSEITEELLTESVKSDVTSSEQPAPPNAVLETHGEKPDILPLAPEVTPQRSQSATPTPAPPPEFAEGASRESSMEPPTVPASNTAPHPATTDYNSISDRISEELAQDLTNEAYETMNKIWKAKHKSMEEKVAVEKPVQTPKDKTTPLSLDQKADRVTDQLFSLLVETESSLAHNIHSGKKVQETIEEEDERIFDSERESVSYGRDTSNLQGNEEKTKRHSVPPHLVLNKTSSGLPVDSSPPPLSPPSPYRSSTGSLGSLDYSPPGSPPRHLSQHSAARVVAGENVPHQDSQKTKLPSPSRSSSIDSVVQLLESITISNAQNMVPSERENVDEIVSLAWDVASQMDSQELHSMHSECPPNVLSLFREDRELDASEEHCRESYVKLVYQLTIETIKKLQPLKPTVPVWEGQSTIRSLLAPNLPSDSKPSLEEVKTTVYALLMRGQLPNKLPAVKFLHNMKRPGGREVDFVDQILIHELRGEEPGWVDYSKDETVIKERTADALLQSLMKETAGILSSIAEKRHRRLGNKEQLPARTLF